MKLVLGCGVLDPKDWEHVGWTRVDIDPSVNPDEIVDLQSFPWPWEDESVDEVYSNHYVEHQTSETWIKFVEELYRVLKPNAKAMIIHTNLKSARAFQDPTFKDFIPAERWLYANKSWRQQTYMDKPPYPTCNFKVVSLIYGNFEPGLDFRSNDAKKSMIANRWDAAYDVEVTLIKLESSELELVS